MPGNNLFPPLSHSKVNLPTSSRDRVFALLAQVQRQLSNTRRQSLMTNTLSQVLFKCGCSAFPRQSQIDQGCRAHCHQSPDNSWPRYRKNWECYEQKSFPQGSTVPRRVVWRFGMSQVLHGAIPQKLILHLAVWHKLINQYTEKEPGEPPAVVVEQTVLRCFLMHDGDQFDNVGQMCGLTNVNFQDCRVSVVPKISWYPETNCIEVEIGDVQVLGTKGQRPIALFYTQVQGGLKKRSLTKVAKMTCQKANEKFGIPTSLCACSSALSIYSDKTQTPTPSESMLYRLPVGVTYISPNITRQG